MVGPDGHEGKAATNFAHKKINRVKVWSANCPLTVRSVVSPLTVGPLPVAHVLDGSVADQSAIE